MHLILPKCTLFFRNAPDSRKNAPCFQKCTRLSKKCTPLFQKCTLKNQKCTRAFSLGAFFYQNRCTKPAERVGFEPTHRLPDDRISSAARYDHFDTSPCASLSDASVILTKGFLSVNNIFHFFLFFFKPFFHPAKIPLQYRYLPEL